MDNTDSTGGNGCRNTRRHMLSTPLLPQYPSPLSGDMDNTDSTGGYGYRDSVGLCCHFVAAMW